MSADSPPEEPSANPIAGPKDQPEGLAPPTTPVDCSAESSSEHLTWLEALAADPGRFAALPEELRVRLRQAAGTLVYPDRHARRAFVRQSRRDKKQKYRDHDQAALESTSNRAQKRALRFPQAPPELEIDSEHRRLLEIQAAPVPTLEDPAQARLENPRSCYICKADFTRLHAHYDAMCPVCADLNWLKRHQSADLSGRTALVTGSRVKIGFEIVLMLLRAGARVIATTRFPADSAKRFSIEPDFEDFQERLVVHGLDLRHTPSVEAFADHLVQNEARLDFLIHNACQTVRRPPSYYEHLIDTENELVGLSEGAKSLLFQHQEFLKSLQAEANQASAALPAERQTPSSANLPGLSQASHLSQLDLLGEGKTWRLFPQGMLDGEGQQLDLRAKNSWRMDLHQVPTVELLEVQLVNSIAPFVLNARLKTLMLKVPSADKHIVNVSAMEGQFYRNLKTTRHPHTNMAKAALNMMTRTSAADYVRDGIHMNSVDTGWVTDEDPFEDSVRKQTEQDFTPPLDSVDGAARVMDPIFTGFLTGVHCWGQFLKDYAPTRW